VTRHGSTGDEITIDKDIFDEMYDVHNPLPDKQDYESLEKYYKNKKYVYQEVQKTMNRKYREKFYKYMDKLAASGEGPAIKEDEWTSIKVGEKTKDDLERLYGEYQKFMDARKQAVAYKNVNEYLKQWVLRLIYNNLLSSQDYPDETPSSLAIDEPEAFSNSVEKAVAASENSGGPVSLPVQKSTQNLLDRLRDITFLETYDQVILYLLNLIHSRRYRAFLASLEKRNVLPDNPGRSSGLPGEDNSLEPVHKIRDADDFIIDYLYLLKIKESKK
jgi:hypothetical protein